MIAAVKILLKLARRQGTVAGQEFTGIPTLMPFNRLLIIGFSFFRSESDVSEAPGSVYHSTNIH